MKTSMKLAAVAAVALVGSGLTPTVSAAADAAPAYALNPMVVTASGLNRNYRKQMHRLVLFHVLKLKI